MCKENLEAKNFISDPRSLDTCVDPYTGKLLFDAFKDQVNDSCAIWLGSFHK